MADPTVCAVMLANGRPEMVRRAVACFRAQTYENKSLLIYDSSDEGPAEWINEGGIYTEHFPVHASVGKLRNAANAYAERLHADVIVHWDSDDWSHPRRIEEQVALLQNPLFGRRYYVPAVGYREMLFWDSRPGQFCGAWLYDNPNPAYCLGTSLCYWRQTWEAWPFADMTPSGAEDARWTTGLGAVGVSSLSRGANWDITPRMIAAIHGGNTASRIDPAKPEWLRVSGWDEYCRRTMEL